MWGDDDEHDADAQKAESESTDLYFTTKAATDETLSPDPYVDQPLKYLFQSDNIGFKFKHEHEETGESSDGKCWDFEADGCPQCGSMSVDIDADEEHFLYWVCEECW
eukprot:6955448-Karenia_brevis.AAC.1